MTAVVLRADAFVAAATAVHGERYDYTRARAEYVNAHTKVTIVCGDHGAFLQAPNDHKRGARCPDCSARRASSTTARGDQFRQHAVRVHGDRYDYSESVYIDQHTVLTIICHVHGRFQQRPDSHLAGRNCQACAADTRQTTLLAVAPKRKRPRRRRRTS